MKILKIRFKKKWKQKETILLLERLHLYISAGLSIDRTLETIIDGFTSKQRRQRTSIKNALAGIQAGGSLSMALKNNIGIPDAMVGLISHGESSGGLAKALKSAHALMERQDELKKKVLSAMTYPVIIGIFASGLTIGLVRGVMPQIIPMLKSLHVQLPLLTRVVMFASESLIAYGLYFLVGLVSLVLAGRVSYKRFTFIRQNIHRFISFMPIVGSLVRQYSLAVFLHSFGSLVESGVHVGRAYQDTVKTIAFYPVRSMLTSKSSAISHGSSIGSAFQMNTMPAHVSALISAGEASGTLGTSIIRAAEILDRDIEHSLKRLTSLVEPVMMAGMGIVVGAIAMSIMMPIYDISKVLQH